MLEILIRGIRWNTGSRGVQGSSEMATWRVESGGWSNKLPHKREYSRRAERANFMML